MQKFVSAFIPVLNEHYLIYPWQRNQLKKTIDPTIASDWFLSTRDYMKEESFTFHLFWNKYTKALLILDEEKYTDPYYPASEDVNQIIKTYSKWWIITDEFFQILTRIFHYYEPVKINIKWAEHIVFRKLDTTETPFIWQLDFKVNDQTYKVSIDKPLTEIDEEMFRYKNIMLLLKEVQMWFWTFRSHSLAIQDSRWRFQQQNYKIAQDLVITLAGDRIISVEAEETTWSLTKIDWVWTVDIDWEKIKSEDFNPITTIDNNDWTQTIKIRWAYTHILRRVLSFRPQTWQYNFLMRQNRLNVVAWTRRAGKTLLASYMILRNLFINPDSRKHIMRQPKTLYIAPTEEKFKAVTDYIEASSEAIRILKVLKYDKKWKRLTLVDELVWAWGKKVLSVVATCDFVSCKWYEPARWNGSDDIMMDEASFIPEDVYLNILPILENENARLFAISTIDWQTPKHWFYERLIEYEQNNDPDGLGMRVTIDDIDSNIISDMSKERIKSAMKDNIERYYAELYATFPSINTVFNTTHMFVLPDRQISPKEIIIWYDPAKRSDFWGVVVWEIFYENGELRCFVTEEYRLQWDYNTVQKEFLFNLKNKYMLQWYKTSIIMDATVVWDVVAEIMGNLIDYKVWYSGNTTKPEIDKYWVWHFAKKNLVHMLQILIDVKKVQAYTTLKTLIEEMKNFKMIMTPSWNIKYEAVAWHDDIVNASMLIWFYFWFILWQISTIQYDVNQELKFAKNSALKQNANLYNEYQKRQEKIPFLKWTNTNYRF